MTFIASVVAKNGVVVITDSFVTSSLPTIQFPEFWAYYQRKKSESTTDQIPLQLNDIFNLFQRRPVHTKDYEDKLFQFGQFSAITTTGAAELNGRKISDIIEEIRDKLIGNPAYTKKSIELKVKAFIHELNRIVATHISTYKQFEGVRFLYTNYNPKLRKTSIFRINVNSCNEQDLNNTKFKICDFTPSIEGTEYVVTDGQNNLTENVLTGDYFKLRRLTDKLLDKISQDFKIEIPPNYSSDLIGDSNFSDDFLGDYQQTKLSHLSLQQAVDLAMLLMRLEIDFQKYTKDIPTVGGNIRLAIIDKDGFKNIKGHEIEIKQ